MLRCTPRSQCAEHKCDQQNSAAANNQWQKYRQNGAPNIRLMRAGQADAIKHNFPDAHDKAATKRNDKQRIDGAAGKTNDAKSCFKRMSGAANDHQTNMKDGRKDEGDDCREDRRQNDHENGSNSRANQARQTMSIA